MPTISFSVNTFELLNTLQMFKNIIRPDKNCSHDYLKITTESEENKITITGQASGQYVILTSRFDADVAAPDVSFGISYSELLAAITVYKDTRTVDFEVIDEGIKIIPDDKLTYRTFQNLPTNKLAEIPVIGADAAVIRLSDVELNKALTLTAPFAAKGVMRYSLNNVVFCARDDNSIDVVASDTHRMGVYNIADAPVENLIDRDGSNGLAGFGGLVLAWLQKGAKFSSNVTLSFGYAHGVVSSGEWNLYYTLPEGMFPRYRDVIPASYALPGQLIVDTKALLTALKDAKPVLNEETRAIILRPNAIGNAVNVEVFSRGLVLFSRSVMAASAKCPDVVLNAAFLTEALKTSKNKFVEIRFGEDGSGSPCVLAEGSYQHILMPLNNQNDKNYPAPDTARYQQSCTLPDQASPLSIQPQATKRHPSFAAVVKHAKADEAYRQELLAALDVNVLMDISA